MIDRDALESEAERVAARIRARGEWVSADLRVREDVAADFLGRKPKTLSNWRSQMHELAYNRGPPVTYRLVDLLRFVRDRDAA